MRESTEELTNAEVDTQIKSVLEVLEVGVMADIGPHPSPLRHGVPSTR
jgi:hypothetical protein